MEDVDFELHALINVKLNVVNVKISRQIGQAVQSKANLRLPEWRIISRLASSGPMSQADIRGDIGMDKGQISRTVKTMLDNELLNFEGKDAQARNVRLCLTEKGQEVHRLVDIAKVLPGHCQSILRITGWLERVNTDSQCPSLWRIVALVRAA